MVKRDWNYTKPPNEIEVEVEYKGKVITAKAIWGRDGTRPHWEYNNGTCASPDMFSRWRLK